MADSFVRVPPDGAGKRIQTTQHTVSGNTVETQHVHISDGDNPLYIQKIAGNGSSFVRYNEGEPIFDGYNNFKISNSSIVGVYEHSVDSYDDLYTIDTESGGTSEFSFDTSCVKLITSSEPNSKCIRTSNRYHYYQPGTSIVVLLSVSCGDTGKDNNKRQWGYYDDYNGAFFELSGTTLQFIARGDTSGTVKEMIIPQSEWSVDKLDGTGPSGINIDITKGWMYFISATWPFGVVRFGIYGEKGRIVCHTIEGGNYTSVPSIETCSLPIRFSNINIGSASSGSELKEIMAVVKCELNPDYTFWRFGDLEVENKTVTTNTPIISFKSKEILDNGNINRVNSFPETLSVYSSGATTKISFCKYTPIDLTGATWDLNSVNGPLMADTGATNINMNDVWKQFTIYAPKDTAINIDLKGYFELNDEGILLSANGISNNIFGLIGTAIGGSSVVTTTMSYRGLY
jgi:hypothetical protein